MVGKLNLERDIEGYLLNRIRLLKGEIRKVRWIGRRFAPDRMAWIPGWAFPKMIELKAPGKVPTDGQTREHARLRKMNIEVFVIDSFEEIDRLLGV